MKLLHKLKRLAGQQKGFSLVELLVVLGIFVIFTAVVLVKQGAFNNSTALTNLAYDIAATIRKAQVFGTGVRESGASGEFGHSFGVRIGFTNENKVTPTEYILCSDHITVNNLCNGGLGEIVETFTIQSGYKIKSICGYWGGSLTCEPFTKNTDIFFKRPDPEAIIWKDTSLATPIEQVEITVSNLDETDERIIVVNSTGRISVETP